METLGQLLGGGGGQVAPDVPVAAGQPTMFPTSSSGSTTADVMKLMSADNLDGLMRKVQQVKQFQTPPAAPMSLPSLQRRGGGGVPSPTALQFLKALSSSPGSGDPRMAAIVRALTQGQA